LALRAKGFRNLRPPPASEASKGEVSANPKDSMTEGGRPTSKTRSNTSVALMPPQSGSAGQLPRQRCSVALGIRRSRPLSRPPPASAGGGVGGSEGFDDGGGTQPKTQQDPAQIHGTPPQSGCAGQLPRKRESTVKRNSKPSRSVGTVAQTDTASGRARLDSTASS